MVDCFGRVWTDKETRTHALTASRPGGGGRKEGKGRGGEVNENES